MIRAATIDDYERLAEIYVAAFPSGHAIPDECWKGHEANFRLILPYWPVLAFESDGVIEGFLCLVDKHITDFFVMPSKQGRGIGGSLLRRAKEMQPALELEVYSHNVGAVSFYSKAGCVVESRYVDWCADKERLRMKWSRDDARGS